jgi:hypothetical protein
MRWEQASPEFVLPFDRGQNDFFDFSALCGTVVSGGVNPLGHGGFQMKGALTKRGSHRPFNGTGTEEKCGRRTRVAAFIMAILAVFVLTGCRTVPQSGAGETPAMMEQVMERKNRIVLLSGENLVPDQPTLLLLHGATDDPSEMLAIADQWAETHNVFLYSYNFHQSIERLARDLIREMKGLETTTKTLTQPNGVSRKMTVIVYSYSAIVFRKSVLLADDQALFADVSLIQLVPTAGGSHLARGLKNPVAAFLVSLASMPSTAQNPYGSMAKELWGIKGSRKFDAAINPDRVQTFLVDDDSHSLADTRNKDVQERYRSGIGSNVVMIPQESGVTHENFPNHPVALYYLQKTLESKVGFHAHKGISRASGPFDRNNKPLN